MAEARVLLVDDDHSVTDQLAPVLERAGFAVSKAHNGEQALERIQNQRPDLVVLDVIMPGVNGREVCRRLRAAGDWTPVIMLTSIDNPLDRSQSLDEGADDYLGKPFHPNELLSRMRAVLRRHQRAGDTAPLSLAPRLKAGGIVIDRKRRQLEKEGQVVEVTPKAFAVLEYLMLHADELISRERLLDAVWAWDHPVATRVVDVRIAELRKAIDEEGAQSLIETAIGSGYRFTGKVVPVT